jgi:hypothetical protein
MKTEPGTTQNDNKTPQYSLVVLEDHLKRFSLSFQLEILRSQAEHLARTRWKDQLAVEYVTSPHPALRVQFWAQASSQGQLTKFTGYGLYI